VELDLGANREQGIITSMSRNVGFPAALCSIAEQVYFSALDRGWGANDDAGLVRLWTSEPVSSIQSNLSAEDKEAKLELVVDLLTGIHLVSAAESISLAKHVGIPLPQLYELACDAAGGSTMFKEAGAKMIPILEGKEDGKGKVLGGYIEVLRMAVNEAQAIKCPLYLGTGVLNLLLQTGSELSLASLMKCYMP
jgi:3-hydroxyisobutyrate dehydrogenase